MNRIAAAGLAALLSLSGCAQIEQPIQKEKTAQKIEQPPQKEKTTQKIPAPPKIQSREKSLDEMMISEEQTAYKNADALSRRIPREFEKETFGEYILYHDKGITAGKQANQDGSPKLNGKGRAVLIKGNTNLIAGYFNYASQGREKGLIPQGAEADNLWRFAYVASSNLIAMSTGKSSFGYSKKGDKWSVMEINMTAFKTTQEFTRAIMSEPSQEEMKITDLSKRPTRTKAADPDKVKKYQAVLDRFFDTYTPVKPQTQNTYEKPSGKSIDEIFKEGEERIYNQARNVISNPASGNLLKHTLDNGATVYHDSSLVFSGNKMSGSGNYIMQDKDGGVVVAFEDARPSSSTTKPDKNFLFVCKNNKITLINNNINITYFHAEKNGWMKREMNPRDTGTEKEEALIMEYISRGDDFKNTDLSKISVRATIKVPPELIERYALLKQMIDKAYPLEKR